MTGAIDQDQVVLHFPSTRQDRRPTMDQEEPDDRREAPDDGIVSRPVT